MEINEYVRTIDGIKKINHSVMKGIGLIFIDGLPRQESDVLKSSFNLIDLIEKGDILVDYNDDLYVVDYIDGYYVFTTAKINKTTIKTLVDYQIKKVLTKEQFESNAYKIEKER